MAKVQMEGIQGLLRELQRLGEKANRIENQALKEGAEPVAQAMRQKVRVSTKNQPHIRYNIEISRVKQEDNIKYVEVGPNKETNWRARFLEFGTSKMRARPFMGPAAAESRGKVLARIERALRRGLGLR